jgi:hypothetical protein
MKKVVTLALATVLSLSMFGLLAGCAKGADDIASVTVGINESNGVEIKVYKVKLEDSVVWADLSEANRERLAVAGFEAAQEKIAEDGTFNYQIIGQAADEPITFLFDAENQRMIVYLAGEQVGEAVVEVPEN